MDLFTLATTVEIWMLRGLKVSKESQFMWRLMIKPISETVKIIIPVWAKEGHNEYS